ncbi:hypothetical protein BKA67DRAFT_539303 [Truncatella angustata]|uniref:Uncharacterized protein n=1 Tax=Truncatella angustata TaxID=152316 RepID=A0A9P8RJY5_9PEZI|nr:uncharacterized protein BKA67DRAFT_539303 [Truncatella angustata]KAH6647441.1 hypothetical protein BKA67DRAFT_539303 [Truncatella angustata]
MSAAMHHQGHSKSGGFKNPSSPDRAYHIFLSKFVHRFVIFGMHMISRSDILRPGGCKAVRVRRQSSQPAADSANSGNNAAARQARAGVFIDPDVKYITYLTEVDLKFLAATFLFKLKSKPQNSNHFESLLIAHHNAKHIKKIRALRQHKTKRAVSDQVHKHEGQRDAVVIRCRKHSVSASWSAPCRGLSRLRARYLWYRVSTQLASPLGASAQQK